MKHRDSGPLHFDLRTPCSNCPFRRDSKPHEGMPAKIVQLFEAWTGLGNAAFTCHRTDPNSDWPPARNYRGPLQHCAGFMILMEKAKEPSEPMRKAAREGRFDRTKLNLNAPVFSMMGMLKFYAKWGSALLASRTKPTVADKIQE